MAKITRHGGPSQEEPSVKIRRPSIVPGATDRKSEGGEQSSRGSNSTVSSEKEQTRSGSNKPKRQSPAQTTDSHSSMTNTETSDVSSTDGNTQQTVKESPKPTKRGTKSAPRKANIRQTSVDDFD